MTANQLKPEQAAQILTHLFNAAEIVTFEYWADFILRVQRKADLEQSQTMRIPPIFCIRLESDWWIGDRKQWDETKKQFPIRELRHYSTQDVPMRAAVIGQMLGSRITEVRVAVDGTLTILTTDNFTMTVPGVSRAVDYSWSVELPADDPDRTEWSLVCEVDGQLYGHIPTFKLA